MEQLDFSHPSYEDACSTLQTLKDVKDLNALVRYSSGIANLFKWSSFCVACIGLRTETAVRDILQRIERDDVVRLACASGSNVLLLVQSEGLLPKLQQQLMAQAAEAIDSSELDIIVGKLTACSSLVNSVANCVGARLEWLDMVGKCSEQSCIRHAREIGDSGLLRALAKSCSQLSSLLQQYQQTHTQQHHSHARSAKVLKDLMKFSSSLEHAWINISMVFPKHWNWCGASLKAQVLQPTLLPASGLAAAVLQAFPLYCEAGAAAGTVPGNSRVRASSHGSTTAIWTEAAKFAVRIGESIGWAVTEMLQQAAGAQSAAMQSALAAMLVSKEAHQLLPIVLTMFVQQLHEQQRGLSPASVAEGQSAGVQQKKQLQVPPYHLEALKALNLTGIDSKALVPSSSVDVATAMLATAVSSILFSNETRLNCMGPDTTHTLMTSAMQKPLLMLFVEVVVLLPAPPHAFCSSIRVLPELLEGAKLVAGDKAVRALNQPPVDEANLDASFTPERMDAVSAASSIARAAVTCEFASVLLHLLGPAVMHSIRHDKDGVDAGSVSAAASAYGELVMEQLVPGAVPGLESAFAQQPALCWSVLEMCYRAVGCHQAITSCPPDCACLRHIASQANKFIFGAYALGTLLQVSPAIAQTAAATANSTPRVFGVLLTWLKVACCCLGSNLSGSAGAFARLRALALAKCVIHVVLMLVPQVPDSPSSSSSGAGGAAVSSTAPWLTLVARSLSVAAAAVRQGNCKELCSGSSAAALFGSGDKPPPGAYATQFTVSELLNVLLSGIEYIEALLPEQIKGYRTELEAAEAATGAVALTTALQHLQMMTESIALAKKAFTADAVKAKLAEQAPQGSQQASNDRNWDLEHWPFRKRAVAVNVMADARNVMGSYFFQALFDDGMFVSRQLPLLYACNFPGCMTLLGFSELECVGGKVSRCSGCHAVRYCSRACQKAHWGLGHKPVCQAMQAVAAAAASVTSRNGS